MSSRGAARARSWDLLEPLVRADRRAALALVYTALCLTALEYGFYPPRVEARLQGLPGGALRPPSLEAGVIWALGTIALLQLVPLVWTLALWRAAPASIGYRLGGFARHVRVYGLLFLAMAPLVVLAARRPDFQASYPFVREAALDLRRFAIWELFYLAQFFALESFFRGFLLFTLERAIGPLAIFVMAVPYCMIHYHKPPLEAVGAVLAGLVLGALALRYRSWYGGALLHCLVAATMDVLAVHRAGLLSR
jgi:membrane protease YdiL (CAAX protease family)